MKIAIYFNEKLILLSVFLFQAAKRLRLRFGLFIEKFWRSQNMAVLKSH